MESFRFLEPFQTVRHGIIIIRPRSALKPPARSSR
jgi:hypothetical protein